MPSDRGGVSEDADAEHDHDRRGQLSADTELVAHEDDQRSDQDVGDEGDHEHLGIEDAVEPGADSAEHRVQCRDHRDGQVRLEPDRHRRAKDEPENHADD
jgi:hypothetical protein